MPLLALHCGERLAVVRAKAMAAIMKTGTARKKVTVNGFDLLMFWLLVSFALYRACG